MLPSVYAIPTVSHCSTHSSALTPSALCALCRDMPPPGGFEPVKYKRNLPLRGPSGLVILGGVTAVCAYGFYRLGKGNLEKRYVESLQSFVRAREGQADVKRGQLRARPTGNVAFCWIRPRDPVPYQ